MSNITPSTGDGMVAKGYTDNSASRTDGTVYQNSTGNVLQIAISVNSWSGSTWDIELFVGETSVESEMTRVGKLTSHNNDTATPTGTIVANVPSGYYYLLKQISSFKDFEFWSEQEMG